MNNRLGRRAKHDGDGAQSQYGAQTGTLSHHWPSFLMMALVTLLYGLGVVPLGGNGYRTRANVDFGDEGAVDGAFLGNFKQLRALLFG